MDWRVRLLNASLLYSFIFYVSIGLLTSFHMVKAGLREFREVRRKLHKKGLTLWNAFLRRRPYDFQPEKPASLREAAKRGGVFSLFIFSLTGAAGTIMLALNLTPLETPCQIFYAAITVALIFLPILILTNYAHQRLLKRFGEPFREEETASEEP